MDKCVPLWIHVDSIKWAMHASRDETYSENVRRVFGEYANALITSYRCDDYLATLISK